MKLVMLLGESLLLARSQTTSAPNHLMPRVPIPAASHPPADAYGWDQNCVANPDVSDQRLCYVQARWVSAQRIALAGCGPTASAPR